MSLSRLPAAFDAFQRRHSAIGFGYAVIKKYGDDHGGYQAALITYYGFLSLFPLLLILVTLIQLTFGPESSVRAKVITSIGHYFPLLSQQLQSNVHTARGEGIGLVIGLLITFYGARGGINVVSYTLNNIWHVPKNRRHNFFSGLWRSLVLLAGGGFGFIVAAVVSTFSSRTGTEIFLKIITNVVGMLIIAGVLLFISHVAIARRLRFRNLLMSSLGCAVLLQLLITFGTAIMAHELKRLDQVYGTFALILGLLFWIYLLAQIFIYSAEVDTVRYWHLWPRGLVDQATEADGQARSLH